MHEDLARAIMEIAAVNATKRKMVKTILRFRETGDKLCED